MSALLTNGDAEVRIARMESAEMQAVVSEAELRALRDAMEGVMSEVDGTIALLRSMAGTEPGPVAAEFLRQMLMGKGWFTSARDTLNRLFKVRSAAAQAAGAQAREDGARAETEREIAAEVERLERTLREQGRVRKEGE